ncbi:MAG: hypothetical protein V4547_04035 [Bacteroidota bacterium]
MRHIKLTVITFAFLVTACATKKQEIKINDQLLDFQSWTVMSVDELVEAGEQTYKGANSKQFNSKTDTIRFDKDIIYISYLSIVNGCGQYGGDIEVKADSIILKLNNLGGIECTEQRCDRLIFKIKNTENKEYKIKKW